MTTLALLLATATVLSAAAARRPAGLPRVAPGSVPAEAEARGAALRRLVDATSWGRRRRDRRRDAQLPHWLERVASALRAGEAPAAALISTRGTTPSPLGTEIDRMATEIEHGAGVRDVLDRWRATSAGSAAVDLAASALALGIATGGEVARAVDQVAATLGDRLEAQAEVVALATQARTSAWVLGVAPAGFTALIATVEPGVPQLLLGTPLGLGCLALGVSLQAAGVAWMARIVRSAT